MSAVLERAHAVDRCEPKSCKQQERCARSSLPAVVLRGRRIVIDASTTTGGTGWCPMFIDSRGAPLDPRLQHLECF